MQTSAKHGQYFARRMAIRQTWMQHRACHIRFVMGYTANGSDAAKQQAEIAEFQDVIRVNVAVRSCDVETWIFKMKADKHHMHK